MYITNKVQEFIRSNTMNMTELLAISKSNLSLKYDTNTKIFSLYMDIGNYPYCIYSGSNVNNSVDEKTLSYIAEVIIYFSQCTPPTYDVDGLDICEVQEMYSDCLILQPVHSKKTANTVAIEVIYCDSNGEDNYICSIPDLSFKFSKVEARFIGKQIDEIEHN